MSKVTHEFTGVSCFTCLLFNANGTDALETMTDTDADEYIDRVSDFMAKYTFDACDQWSDGYNEFSVQRCDCCGDSSGGDRYETTFTQFERE